MGLNKRLKSKSGAVSVYLCIIMSAVILLGGVLVDVARIKGAQTITEDTTVSVTRSLMSFYNRDLEKYYGILGVDIKPEVKEAIPVAQWAIILAWCVAESAIDVTQLLDGKSVPLVKSPTTWVLSESGLIDAAKYVVEERAKEAAKTIVDESFDEIEKVVNKAITDIEVSIDSQLNQLVNKLVEPLETNINNLSSMGLSEANKVVNSCFLGIQDEINSYNGDGIVFEALKTYAQSWLEEIQTKIITEVENAVSKPEMIISKYKKLLVQKIKEPLTLVKEQLIAEIKAASKQGRDALKSKISKIFASDSDSDSSGDLASKNYKSGFITMRYKDYLRLYLLVVPEKDKFIRIRKIIEENIQKKSGDTGFTINRLNTIVKADVQVATKYFLISPNLIPSQYKSGDNNRHLIKSTYEVAYLGGKIQ